MGKAQTPHFHDFGILGSVQPPQNQLFLSLETPGHHKQIKKNTGTVSQNNIFTNLKIRKIHCLTCVETVGTEHDEDMLNKILRILHMGSISS